MARVWRSGRFLLGLILAAGLASFMLVTVGATAPSPDRPISPDYLPIAHVGQQTTQPIHELGSSIAFTVFLPSTFREFRAPLAPLCRYGVTAGASQLQWLPTWRAGWTLDFSAHAPPAGISAEFAQVIRVRQQKDGCTYLDGYRTIPALTEASLGAVIGSAPGAIWLVGNEPDRGPNLESCNIGVQDDTYPEVYARAYHDVYHFIKQRDPTAQVTNAGLVQVTPGRLQYLDKMWQAYLDRYGTPMPVDVWNMHLYILPEMLPDGDKPNGIANIALGTDPALGIRESGGDPNRCGDPQVYCFAEHDDLTLFAEQVTAMRAWMKQKGQQDKPLILSEYSLLYPYELDDTGCFLQDENGQCFTPQRVADFMIRSFDYLETAADPDLGYPRDHNRLVQRWMWYAAYAPGAGEASSLINKAGNTLTLVGEQFRDQVAGRAATVNLFPGAAGGHAGYIIEPSQTATVTLYVDILNNGSTAYPQPFVVTFYADAALTQPINSTVVFEALGGCARNSIRASVTWPGLPVGEFPFWVKIDRDDAAREEDETDNIAMGRVTVYAHGRFLPLVFR